MFTSAEDTKYVVLGLEILFKKYIVFLFQILYKEYFAQLCVNCG